MNIFFKEHRDILQALLHYQADFLLIGGYAVNYYGYNRVTGDMDIWINPDNQNKELLLRALASLGFDEEGIDTIRGWDFSHPQKFHIGGDGQPDKTEFMTHISGVNYSIAKENSILADIDGLSLPLIHYNDLIQNKKATGRAKDRVDVEYLEKIMHLKNK
ncbi:MAG: hypothetical protein KIT80_22945 [Chitinophagaceae bacterium]|nr:hypothetical protein [Chitinophagaceae bacterium]MCW5929796.1 hypothetical protein [Chitinophagaceae bacterium]